jgi:hypothetical protein
MAIDPLATATRTAKRNLLAASTLAITYKAFNITIDNIPVMGLSIRFDKGAFEFLLLSAIVYFGATFLLYYIIDIRNLEQTLDQGATKENIQNRHIALRGEWQSKLAEAVSAVLPLGYRLDGWQFGTIDVVFNNCSKLRSRIDERALHLGDERKSVLKIVGPPSGAGMQLDPVQQPTSMRRRSG